MVKDRSKYPVSDAIMMHIGISSLFSRQNAWPLFCAFEFFEKKLHMNTYEILQWIQVRGNGGIRDHAKNIVFVVENRLYLGYHCREDNF